MSVSETMERGRMSIEDAAESLKRWFLGGAIDGEIRMVGDSALKVDMSREYSERNAPGLYKHEFDTACKRVRDWKKNHPSPFATDVVMLVKDGEKITHSFGETLP